MSCHLSRSPAIGTPHTAHIIDGDPCFKIESALFKFPSRNNALNRAPSAGLFRDLNPLFVLIFTVLTTYVFKVASSEAEGGRRLAFMVADPFLNNVTGAYLSGKPGSLEFNPILASEEAADQANGKKIWELTEKIVKENV